MAVASMSTEFRCDSCRFWSEMMAQVDGTVLEAVCLSGDGPYAGTFTPGARTCNKWKEAPLGSVDDPVHRGSDPYKVEA